MTAFAMALDGIYADPNFGEAALYAPLAGGSFPVTVIWDRPMQGVDVNGMSTRLAKTAARVRVSEVAAPKKKDVLTIVRTGKSYEVGNRDLDDQGLQWTLDLKG